MTTAEIEVEQTEDHHRLGDRDPLQHVALKVTGKSRTEIAVANLPTFRTTTDLASAAVIVEGDPRTPFQGTPGRR